MSTKLEIFITGATGYIGGTVLDGLLKHPNVASFHIIALVRSEEKGKKLKTLGIDTILGSYTDEDLKFLTEAAARADVVITMADADKLAPAKAILLGMKKKYESTGVPPILIHTSGTAIVTDDARGMHSEHTAYSDSLDASTLDALPESVVHRHIDIPIQEADRAGIIKAYLIAPGTIFGYPTGSLVNLGIQNTHSIQLPPFIKAGIARKQGGYLGKGLNHWPAVHVEDTADLYLILFNAILAHGEGPPHGYYFVETCDYSAIEVATAISEALVDLKVGTSRKPSAFTDEETQTFFGPKYAPILSTNCYAKADRARALGWKPKYGKAEFLASLKAETEAYLKFTQ